MKFEDLGLAETLLRAVPRRAIPSPPKFKPPRFRRSSMAATCWAAPDGNRQDGRVRPANLAAAGPRRMPREWPGTQDPRPCAGAHPRTVAANRREFPGLRPPHQPALRGDLRRRGTVAPGAGPERRHRHRRGHARPTAGSHAARLTSTCRMWRSSCSTRPIGCSTWASSTICGGSWKRCPRRRQTLLFSATLPPAIRTLAGQWLTDPRGRARRARLGHRARRFGSR